MKPPTLRQLRVEAGRRGLGKRISVERIRCGSKRVHLTEMGWEYTIRSKLGDVTIRCLAPTKTGARAAVAAALKTVPRTKEGQLRHCVALIKRGAW